MKKSLTAHAAGTCVLVTLLLFIKSYLFYSHVNLAGFHPLFAVLTAGIFLFLWSALSLLSQKTAKTVMFTVYVILSVFMTIDAVYYSYVSKMPSAAMIPMLWQATGISDTILNLLKPYHMAMLIDLPLWCMRAANRDEEKNPRESARPDRPAASGGRTPAGRDLYRILRSVRLYAADRLSVAGIRAGIHGE